MDAINKTKRTVVRSQTTKLFNKIETKLLAGNAVEEDLEQFLAELELKKDELHFLDTEVQKNIKLDELESEVLKCDEYNSNLIIWKTKVKLAKSKLETRSNLNVSTSIVSNSEERALVRGFESTHINLPRLMIDKFDGDPSDWQRFWDQYESAIHKNTEISNVDKFNYLRSYLKGIASDAIKGFTLTNVNYLSAIDTLKDRFGKKTLVVNSHLNKLLSLTQVKKSSDIVSLRKLFDSCQTEIRNLEALGIKEDNYGTLFCPILIRLLPHDIVLEITKNYASDEDWKISEIIEILRKEVESREKAIALISNTQNKEVSPSNYSKHYELPKSRPSTASGLLNESNNRRNKCFYCDSDEHWLPDCEKFKIKQIDEKRNFLMKRGCCFICFHKGHLANKCKSSIKCSICLRRHYEIMCPENKTDEITKNESTALSNKTCNQEVLMQTLTVRLINANKDILIRALIDTGSQKSYLTKEIISKIGYTPIGQEKLYHNLFGGIQQTHEHNKYRIYLSDLHKRYFCNFEVYDQEKICARIPKIKDGPWIEEAKRRGISFSDYEGIKGIDKNAGNHDIHLLIGADVCGKLFTSNMRSLTNNLNAFETRLGWTLMGKTNEVTNADSTNVVLSLHVADVRISDLRKLDTLGILDPGIKTTREELEMADEEHFNRNIRIVEDGRYEVSSPWVHGHPPLPRSRSVAEQRLKNCEESLKKSGNLAAHEAVFKEWSQEGISEEVASDDDAKTEYYLPHRAVIKENSTTKIKPLFDDSAKIKGSASINDCLEKDPNLVGATLQYHLSHAPEEFRETVEKLSESFYVNNYVTSVKSEDDLKKFSDKSKFILNTAHFDLRWWEHNTLQKQAENTIPTENHIDSILELKWNLNEDIREDIRDCDIRDDEDKNEIVTKIKLLEDQQQKLPEAEKERIARETEERTEQRLLREQKELKKEIVIKKIEEIKKIEINSRIFEGMDEDELQNLDPDDLLNKQVEQLDRERKELQAKLRKQERKVDYVERVKIIEEISLLQAEYEEHKSKELEFWEYLKKERIKAIQEERPLTVQHRDRLLRLKNCKDKFYEKLGKVRSAVYQEKLAELKKLLDDERKKRLDERKQKSKEESHIKEGAIVIIGDDNIKRVNWPLGRIQAMYPGKDGRTRVVRVQTQNGCQYG